MTYFRAGDTVRWKSKGRVKEGRVLRVVPAGERVGMGEVAERGTLKFTREVAEWDRYLVLVGSRHENARQRVYCPSVAMIERQGREVGLVPEGWRARRYRRHR